MNSKELKLFTICYIKEDEVLTNREKIDLMEYVEDSNDEKILFLLQTGSIFPATESADLSLRDLQREEKSYGPSTVSLAGSAVSALATAVAMKVHKKYISKMSQKCDKEQGIAKKTCHNKIKRDSIRTEILSLTSMKIKCQKAKNTETCIRNIDKRIKQLQKRMDSIKIF